MRLAHHLVLLNATPLSAGCKVSKPFGLEAALVGTIKHRITVGNKTQTNPRADTAKHIAEGKEAFGHYCVVCHGLDGQNTGVPFAERMDPPIPSLASTEVQEYSDGQLKWIIDNGIAPSGMPASHGTLADEEIWSIVVYLRHLPTAGSFGEPDIYTH